MAEEILNFEKRDSIEIKTNAKGEVSWAIKRYYNAEEQGSDTTVSDLAFIHAELKRRFL